MSNFDNALRIAASAHRGQKDKGGKPYILHPLRIALRFTDETLQIISVLHDVVEDSNVSLEDLQQEGFSAEVIAAVEALTKREGESYEAFIERAKQNPLAKPVKRQDIHDNLDLRRLKTLGEKDVARIQRYLHALEELS